MKTKTAVKFIGMLGLVVLLCAPSALAWSINPAKWILYHKDDYEIKSYDWPMEIENTADTPIALTLEPKTPEYLYNGSNGGPQTIGITDFSWIYMSKTELRLEPHTKETVMVTINITNETQNYNQSFELWIFGHQTEGAGNIRTDYNCRWIVQTPVRWVPFDQRTGYVPPWIMPLVIIVVVGIVAGLVLAWKLPRRRHAIANGNGASRVEEIQKHKQREQEKSKTKDVINESSKQKPLMNNNPINQPNVIRYKKPQR